MNKYLDKFNIKVLIIIVLATVIVGYFISKTYWAADDFVYMQKFNGQSLSWNLITKSYDQHVVPMFITTWWVVDRIANGNYFIAASIMTAGFMILQYSFWRLLKLFSLSDMQRYFLLIFFVLSSTIIHNFIWWAAFLSSVVPLIFIVNFFIYSIRYSRRYKKFDLVKSVFTFLISSLFFEKMALYSVVIFVFLLFFENYDLSIKTGIEKFKKLKFLWIFIAMSTVLSVTLYAYSDAFNSSASKPGIYQLLIYLKEVWLKYFVPQLFGFIYNRFDLFGSSFLTQFISIFFTCVLLLVIIKYKKFPLAVVIFFGAFFAINEAIVAFGRLTTNGYGLGGEVRYHLDSYFLLCVSIAIMASYLNSKNVRYVNSIKLSASILLLISVGFNLYAANIDLKGSVGFASKKLYDNLADDSGEGIADTILNERYIYFQQTPYNQLSNIVDTMNIDMNVIDVGSKVILPSGRAVSAAMLSKFDNDSIKNEESCSVNSQNSVTFKSTEQTEYIIFTVEDSPKDLVEIMITDQKLRTHSYKFTLQTSDSKTFAISTLYMFGTGNLKIDFNYKSNANGCVKEIAAIEKLAFTSAVK